jgi:hypothetical protein
MSEIFDIGIARAMEKVAARTDTYVPASIREGRKFEKMVRRGYKPEKARLKSKHGLSGAITGGIAGGALGAGVGALRGKGALAGTLAGGALGAIGGALTGRARGASEARKRHAVVKTLKDMSPAERAEYYRRAKEEKLRERSARAQELMAGAQAAHAARQWPRR